MEIRINKEILDFKENIVLGLSLRQFIFSTLGCVMAVLIYFFESNTIGVEITSWLCMLGALPFILFGFCKFQGLYFEELILLFFSSVVLENRELSAREASRLRRRLRKKHVKKSKRKKKSSNYFEKS